MKIEFDQIIVLVVIVSCVAMIATGIDGEVKSILAMGCGWLFKGVYSRKVAPPSAKV